MAESEERDYRQLIVHAIVSSERFWDESCSDSVGSTMGGTMGERTELGCLSQCLVKCGVAAIISVTGMNTTKSARNSLINGARMEATRRCSN